tara:strand:+ start:511 stop:1197 length:687 start_codon:yes stop_codon:yes gene_type:complete
MKHKRDEVWYCVNSKGHKIPPYGDSYPVKKPKKGFERFLDVMGWMVGMTLIIFCLMALFSFTPKLECGEEIGAFNNVPVYYNDGYASCGDRNWSSDGTYSYGLKWQCVEFVRRYYYEALNHKMPNRWGNASDYFRLQTPSGEMNTERNLVQYHNGDTKPKVNDILVWGAGTGGYGHVAIITAVLSDGVKVIGQNTGRYCNDWIKVKQNKDGKYVIDKGWCSGILRIKE